MAKTFKAEFKSFFCTYLHSTDSALVRKELKKNWDTHQGQNLEQELDFGDFELNIISCIKYISRKQGLDPTVANSLISSFISNNQSQGTKSSKSPCSELINYQIAQTVKYAVAQSESVLDFVQLFTAIDQFFKFKSVGSNEVNEGQGDSVGINDSSYQQAILSQLVECVAIKLSQDNCNVDFDLGGNSKNETIPFKLKKYISFVDTQTKSIVFNKFEKLGLSMPKSSGTGSNPTLPSHLREIDLDEESQGHEPDLLTDGRQLLGQCAKKEVKADAVKTQQTVTSVHKQNVSEKTEIENVNLTNALNSGKSNSRATNITSEINPTLNNSGSSVRSYFRTTAMEVAFLLDRANSSNPICDDDLEYLKNKFIGWKWTVYESYDTTDTSIATIFSVVSKNQRIDNEIQDDLAEGGFENNRSDICRLKLLKMFQFCAERNRGKLPEKSSRVLTTFRRSSNCTDEMKKILWQIFARDDNNLYENFRIALDELERYKGIVGSDTGMDEKLDYIREQIVQEQRAKSLNEKSSFFQTLMGIVMDGDHYGNYMRSKVAQIMDDYLCHESTGGLSIGQMESFVSSYQTSSQSPQWSEIDRNLFTTSLIRCILSTLNKPKTDIAKIPSFILAALVEISADDSADWRVGALIMISLGNIVIANEGIKIPNASLLAKKLKKVDAVDKDGNVFIADEDKVQKFEEQCNLTYISAMAAHIILQSLFPRDIQAPEVEDDILEIFLTALNTSPDKNTRIICSEFVFRASQNQNNKLNEVSLWKLQPLTNDSIPDIRIYSTAAYVTFLEKLVAGKKTDLGSSLTPHDLDELMDMYATEKLEMDGIDYTTIVNSPILKILKHESNRLKFSNQLFQHLTWSLSTGGEQYLELTFVILEIVYAQISTSFKDSHLPENCLAAIENLFLTNDQKDIYGICSMILVRVSEGLHRSLSTRLLEELYTKLQGQSHGDEKLFCFRALFSAVFIQDVSQYIFRGFDLFFVSQRLLAQLEESKDLSFYDNFKPQINSTRKLEAYKSNLMDTIIRYLDKGSRPPIPTIELLRTCLQQEWNLEKVLYSLTIAAENGQLLPSSALQYAFVPSRFENKDFFKLLLKLALALVQNNQNLDDKFLDFISNRFCSSTLKTMFGSDDEDEMIFWILTRCIQTNHRVKQLPKLILKFCAAWKEKSSGNHRQRLEILAALSAVVNCGEEMEELNPVELKEVFLDAIQRHNPQILETGVHGFLALNTTFQSKCEVSLCDSTDVKLLVQIQRSESSSNSVKVLITDFLQDRKKKLSAGLQVSINLSNLENRTNKEFVSDLPMLLKLGDYEFFESKPFQEKIATILETEESNEILESIILILLEYPHPGNLPIQTLEAVAFSLVNNSEPNNFRLSCQQLLIKVLDLDTGITFSSKLIRYLEADTKFNSNLILKIISKSTKNDQEISRKLQGMVQIQTLLESNKLTEKELNKILADAQGAAIQLDLTSFEQLLCLKFVQPGISPRVMTFIATNILCNDIPSDPESRAKAMKILEHCLVKKGGQGQDSMLEAFAKVLSKEGSLEQPKECVQALFNSWTNINSERKCTVQKQSLILTALALTFKSAHPRQFPYVPYKTVQWLAELVESSVAIIRKLSIRALRALKPESVIHTKPDSSGLRSLINCTGIFKSKVDKKPIKKKNDDVDVDKVDIHLAQRFRQIEFLVFQEIYPEESDEKILSEIERDPEFTERLIELLYSLTFWDLKSLQAVRGDRSQWFRLLLISDLLANYTDSINAQFEIYPSLKKLVEIALEDEEDVEELFHLLHLRFNDPDLKLSLSLIPSLLQSLILLEIQQIWSLLKGQVGDNWLRNLDEFVLAKYLKNKMSTSVSSTFALIFAKRMVNQIGTEFGKELCGVIESIESVASLESLLDIFEGMDKATLRQLQENVKLDQQGTKLKIKDLKIILESQILQDNIPKDLKRRARIERILKALLTNGIPREVISRLMDLTICKRGSKSPLKIEGRARAFEHVIGQASQYRMDSNIFSSLVTILEFVSSADLIQSTNQFISEQVFDGKSGVKDIHQVINEFRLNNSRTTYKWACLRQRFLKSGYEWNILKLKIIHVMNGDKFSEIYKPELTRPKEICDWTKIDIKAWAAEAKVNHETMPQNEFYLEALMVARIAIKLHRNFDLTRVQILCCLTALQKLEKDKNKGQLQQVATGSGKSAIIAVLATIKALEGNFVDIYTSSPVLAERDAKEWSTFYSIFDDLSCDHNGDKGSDYISGAKRCYSKRIVYGDCSQFQFDYLRDKYSALGTLDGRTCDYAIVDEVDSMLLDDSAKLARLSSTLPGMDTIEIIYHFLWDRLSYLKTHLNSFQGQYLYLEGKSSPKGGVISYDFADADTNELANIPDLLTFILTAKPYDLESVRIFPIEDFETFIRSKLTEYASSLVSNPTLDIKLPKYLKEFVRTQIPAWIDSLLTAIKFEENIHYIVDEEQIKPVDFETTGIVQSSTNWNNGLHQFLGLKHSLKIHPETLTTNFLSNLSMFDKYGSNMMGFTGTLGSVTGKAILYNVYKVKLLTLPETNFKRYIQFPDIVVANEEQWLKEIVISTMAEASKGRGILVICETIKSANLISAVLTSFKAKVKLYTRNEDKEQEKHIERMHPGDIIVATNLAGRGTDIKTLEIEPFGGLHVCLTFLPQSERIEAQAFGRTSRQGNKGTGQLVIVQNQQEIKTRQIEI